MPEKQEILQVAKTSKGALGLASQQLGISVSELKTHLKNDSQISDTFRQERENFDTIIKDYKDFQKKLAIIRNEPWAIQSDNSASLYAKKISNTIQKYKQVVKEISNEHNTYRSEYDDIAYNVLSSSPFTTKAHLCTTFNVSESILDAWIQSHPTFSESVELGQAEGEVKARNLLLLASLQPQNKVNTALLKILSNNVYDIKDEAQNIIVNNQQVQNHIEYSDPRDEGSI